MKTSHRLWRGCMTVAVQRSQSTLDEVLETRRRRTAQESGHNYSVNALASFTFIFCYGPITPSRVRDFSSIEISDKCKFASNLKCIASDAMRYLADTCEAINYAFYFIPTLINDTIKPGRLFFVRSMLSPLIYVKDFSIWGLQTLINGMLRK